jgi:hypothetical protein
MGEMLMEQEMQKLGEHWQEKHSLRMICIGLS